MPLFILILEMLMYQIYGDSNYIPDYPEVTYCVLPETFSSFGTSKLSYNFLKNQLRLNRRCTHIRGSLYIVGLHRFDNGTDPDLSFLETIVEISGILRIRENSVRRIPLGNLKIIRGISSSSEKFSLQISHNFIDSVHYLEDLDLHSLRVIMKKDIRVNDNYGQGYLVHRVDWSQILMNPMAQQVKIIPSINIKNLTYKCHPACVPWTNGSGHVTQFCFGPRKEDCQTRVKCETLKHYTWCQFNKSVEIPCDRQCVGGCIGNRPQDCMACRRGFKKDRCVSHCASEPDVEFGRFNNKEDQLVYTTGALCTSQCPGSLLNQDKICVYQCDFSKYYKNGNRCIECPNEKCYVKIGNQHMCDLKKLDQNNSTNNKKKVLHNDTLQKLTDCTIIIGHLYIDEDSFKTGITIPLLYKHFKNVREIIGGIKIHLKRTQLQNLTFFSNLQEIRGTASKTQIEPGMHIFVSSLEFLGLKSLKKVYGVIRFSVKSKLCYDNTIPWKEITADRVSKPTCKKLCHPLCTRGCWGPGNSLCYDCAFKNAGGFCVKNCSDAAGYYSDRFQRCQRCHHFCRDNCTGATVRDCVTCRVAKENGSCVESCSISHYSVSSTNNTELTCKRCHPTCFDGKMLKDLNISAACTGPSNSIGKGGCVMCNKVIKTDNGTRCHNSECPKGFFDTKLNEVLNKWSVQQISCGLCNSLCGSCTDNSTHRSSCMECKGYWFKDSCVSTCPQIVQNVIRSIKQGDQCPVCHSECRQDCQLENDSSTCVHCLNKKLYGKGHHGEFVCLANCPAQRNYTDYINGNFLCLAYEETTYYQQLMKIRYVAIGSVACLVIIVTVIVIFFRWKSRRAKIKAELKAYYSNFNESNMKNLNEHSDRPPNKNRLQMIPIKDLIFDINSKPLGAGAFGKVYRGYWKVPGPDGKMYRLDVVVKVINSSTKASTNEFLEEAQIMASVSHRYCLPLIGVCMSLKQPCLVSAFAEYGSLEKYLHQFSAKLSSYVLLKWSEQIADGMAYLNMRGIIHRDLATRNILVTSKNIVQITDFGLAKLVDDTEDGIVVQSGRVPIRWLALETLLSSTYSSASDVWAYGITLWEIFTFGKRPYGELETNKLKGYLLEGNRLCQPDICTLDVYMIMIKCWLDDPQIRPSFTELKSTFDHFSHNSKRYLCIRKEHQYEYVSVPEDNKEDIILNPLPIDLNCEISQTVSNDIDNCQLSYNGNARHFINPVYYKHNNEDQIVLPKRKKRKRKLGFSNLLLAQSSDSNSSHGSPGGSISSRTNQRIRCDSTSILLSNHISFEGEGSPINPQIAKLLKQESGHFNRGYPSPSKSDQFHHSDRVLNDPNLKENIKWSCLKLMEQNAGSRSPSLSSIDASRKPLLVQNSNDNEPNHTENSPDSGNSHEFESYDYQVPCRINSLGYYNLTPSPTDTVKPTMDLNDLDMMVHNANYNQIVDDEYLEPTPKLGR